MSILKKIRTCTLLLIGVFAPVLTTAAHLGYEEHAPAQAYQSTQEIVAQSAVTDMMADSQTSLLLTSDLNIEFFTKIFVLLIIVVFAMISFLKWLTRKKAND